VIPRVAWCVGAGRFPPFAAHTWVEADGIMVGEDYPADHSAIPSAFGVGLDICDYEGIVAPAARAGRAGSGPL
jgi:hypothetical protein